MEKKTAESPTIENSLDTQDIFQDYIFDLKELIAWLRSNQVLTVVVQLPEGLKLAAPKLIRALETELDITIIMVADPCFGACDLITNKVEQFNTDAIVQFGHAEIPDCGQEQIPVKYIELRSRIEPTNTIKSGKLVEFVKTKFDPGSTIGLLANVQYIDHLQPFKLILEENGFKVMVGIGDNRIKYPGQVLGCNFSSAKSIQDNVTGFLIIADGKFHPLGVGLATAKDVFAYDPINDAIADISTIKDELLRQRSGAIARAKACTNFGIILSTKPGQNRLRYAKEIRSKLKENAMKGTLIAMENVSPMAIDYLNYDAFINTACPRLAIDDYLQYKKPILTPIELEILIGARSWDQYMFDEII